MLYIEAFLMIHSTTSIRFIDFVVFVAAQKGYLFRLYTYICVYADTSFGCANMRIGKIN